MSRWGRCHRSKKIKAFQPGVEKRDPTIFRSFEIDGQITTDTTYRTRIVESFTEVKDKTFIDVGAADGFEARALSVRGAASTIVLEGKEPLYRQALQAAELFAHSNHAVVKGDARAIDELGLGSSSPSAQLSGATCVSSNSKSSATWAIRLRTLYGLAMW